MNTQLFSVEDWLRAYGLEDYLQQLIANGYNNMRVLEDLDKNDLDSIGVTSAGHRKLLMLASKDLKEFRNNLSVDMFTQFPLQTITTSITTNLQIPFITSGPDVDSNNNNNSNNVNNNNINNNNSNDNNVNNDIDNYDNFSANDTNDIVDDNSINTTLKSTRRNLFFDIEKESLERFILIGLYQSAQPPINNHQLFFNQLYDATQQALNKAKMNRKLLASELHKTVNMLAGKQLVEFDENPVYYFLSIEGFDLAKKLYEEENFTEEKASSSIPQLITVNKTVSQNTPSTPPSLSTQDVNYDFSTSFKEISPQSRTKTTNHHQILFLDEEVSQSSITDNSFQDSDFSETSPSKSSQENSTSYENFEAFFEELGFSKKQISMALELNKGDINAAQNFLFSSETVEREQNNENTPYQESNKRKHEDETLLDSNSMEHFDASQTQSSYSLKDEEDEEIYQTQADSGESSYVASGRMVSLHFQEKGYKDIKMQRK